MPAASSAVRQRSLSEISNVPQSATMSLRLFAAIRPSGAAMTSCRMFAPGSNVTTTSACSVTSRGEPAAMPPAADSACMRAVSTSKPMTVKPAFMRFGRIAEPMMPTPTSPTLRSTRPPALTIRVSRTSPGHAGLHRVHLLVRGSERSLQRRHVLAAPFPCRHVVVHGQPAHHIRPAHDRRHHLRLGAVELHQLLRGIRHRVLAVVLYQDRPVLFQIARGLRFALLQ